MPSFSCSGRDITLRPGLNQLSLTTTAGPVGKYDLNQLSVRVKDRRLRLLSGSKAANKNVSYVVTSENPTVFLEKSVVVDTAPSELLAGVEQEINLAVYTGSQNVQEVRQGTKHFSPVRILKMN